MQAGIAMLRLRHPTRRGLVSLFALLDSFSFLSRAFLRRSSSSLRASRSLDSLLLLLRPADLSSRGLSGAAGLAVSCSAGGTGAEVAPPLQGPAPAAWPTMIFFGKTSR